MDLGAAVVGCALKNLVHHDILYKIQLACEREVDPGMYHREIDYHLEVHYLQQEAHHSQQYRQQENRQQEEYWGCWDHLSDSHHVQKEEHREVHRLEQNDQPGWGLQLILED
jgi:hypothetical protein